MIWYNEKSLQYHLLLYVWIKYDSNTQYSTVRNCKVTWLYLRLLIPYSSRYKPQLLLRCTHHVLADILPWETTFVTASLFTCKNNPFHMGWGGGLFFKGCLLYLSSRQELPNHLSAHSQIWNKIQITPLIFCISRNITSWPLCAKLSTHLTGPMEQMG